MNNAIYIERNSRVDKQLNKFVEGQGLVLCYRDKNQRILKNEKLIIAQKKRYIFLRVFSDADSSSISNIYHYLVGPQN